MARLSQKRGVTPRKSMIKNALMRKANAIGFARRREQSAKTIANSVQDVYDYQPGKNRRGGITLTFDEDETRGARYENDELDDEDEQSRRRPRLIGEGEEDERIASDDDEDIDSDAAFDESDEEQFAGSNFKQEKFAKSKRSSRRKAGKNVHFAEVNLDEGELRSQEDAISRDSEDEGNEELEENGEDGEFMDLLDVLDGRADAYLGDEEDVQESKNELSPSKGEAGELISKATDSEEEEAESEDDSDEEERIYASQEDEDDATALDMLDQFVSGLETTGKRKASDEDEKMEESGALAQARKRKRLIRDRTESGMENEFSASAAGPSKLSLDDLLKPLASKQGVLASLKKSVKPLTDSSSPKNQPLPAPLPARIQEKLEREAAYELTKQEVDKWTDTMKRIQEAEHLNFPLQASRTTKVSNLELTAKFKPTTELESSIDRLLRSAKLHEDEINKTEDLMMKDLSVEEVAARRAELRKMRELAFRADAKAKRIAKIKSKTYRRIHKKERAKLMAKLDTSDGRSEFDVEAERLKAETERARERATFRHKNTGKWAKAMRARGELDADQTKDINEMLERGERLRRRIQGVGSGEEDASETSESDEDQGSEDGVIRLKAKAFEELRTLQREGNEEKSIDDKEAKGVFQMKFMKEAAARKNTVLDREIDDFRKEMGEMTARSDSDDARDSGTDVPNHAERLNGHMIFQPGYQVQSSLLPPPPLSALSETSTMRSHDSIAHSPVLTIHDDTSSPPPWTASTVTVPATASGPFNPWLAESSSSTKVTRRKNELVVGKNVSREQKSEISMQKQKVKGIEERKIERDDAVVEITTDEVLLLRNTDEVAEKTGSCGPSHPANEIAREGKKRKDKKKDRKDKVKAEQQSEDDDSEGNSELEEQEAALKKGKKITAFEQRELVARAFAGDNVIRQFADEKRREIEADAPKEVDTTLQGWGSWGGAGVKRTASRPNLIKKVAGIDPKSRADYTKTHVIISERRDKKALKFAVKDLPYPYTSKAQFESRMSTPLGVEWNTRLGFQRETLPRVVKKMGTIIDPLEKM
ncbi:hypothetical protein ACEPAI_309 [Sanghuangporus weigelae]